MNLNQDMYKTESGHWISWCFRKTWEPTYFSCVLTTQIQIFWNSKQQGVVWVQILTSLRFCSSQRPCLSARLPFIGHSNRQIPRARREILTNKSFVNYHP